MKRLTTLLAFVLVLATACQKSASIPSSESTNKAGTVGGEFLAPPPGTIGGGGVTTFTDEQLTAMGRTTGCTLAKLKREDIYDSTMYSNEFAPAYKDGVRLGYTECFSQGTPAPPNNQFIEKCENILEARKFGSWIDVTNRTVCKTVRPGVYQ